jgi:hypothetical protein
MNSTIEALDKLIQTPEYKTLEQAVNRDFVTADNALVASYNTDHWVTLNGSTTLHNASWQIRMGRFVTGSDINGIQVKLAFASLIPRAELKQALKGDRSTHIYTEAIEEYSFAALSAEFAQVRLHIGSLFQQLYPGNSYFLFPMNQTHALLKQYDYDLILPFFDILSFNEALNSGATSPLGGSS